MSVMIITYGTGGQLTGRKKLLMPLDEFNKEVQTHYQDRKCTSRNGIECPSCINELIDCGDMVLLTCPPQKEIECIECGWKGYRYC